MAGLSHRDVALLNSSLEGLGNTFMQNRLLDEKMKERQDARTLREQQMAQLDQYRKDTLKQGDDRIKEQTRHNTAMESGNMELWAVIGEGDEAVALPYKGNVAGADVWKKYISDNLGSAVKFGGPLPEKFPGTLDLPDGTKIKFASVEALQRYKTEHPDYYNDAAKIKAEADKKYQTAKLPPAGDDKVAITRAIDGYESLLKQPQLEQADRSKIERKIASLYKELEAQKPERPHTEHREINGRKFISRLTDEEFKAAQGVGATKPETGSRFKIIGTK